MAEKAKKILIAEDSRDIGDILKAELEAKGYRVLTSKVAEETLRIIGDLRPDLIVMDILLRDAKGVPLCTVIKADKKFKEIPVILLAAETEEMGCNLKKEYGAEECVTKPFIISEIEMLIMKHLRPDILQQTRISIEDAIEKKKRDNRRFALCSFELHPDASLIFEQKYGEIRYSELLETVVQLIEQHAKKYDEEMILEHDAEDRFKLLLEGEKEKIKTLMKKIQTEVNTAVRGFYSTRDLQQGFVLRRDILTGTEVQVPLLSISTEVSFP